MVDELLKNARETDGEEWLRPEMMSGDGAEAIEELRPRRVTSIDDTVFNLVRMGRETGESRAIEEVSSLRGEEELGDDDGAASDERCFAGMLRENSSLDENEDESIDGR